MSSKVSVILPVYNNKEDVEKSIRSVLNQTYANWELIIVDDASTDGTLDTIKGVMRELQDTRIMLSVNERNFGCYISMNKGIKLSSGDYITRIDSDDTFKAQKLQTQVDVLDGDPNLVATSSALNREGFIPKDAEVTYMYRAHVIDEMGYYDAVRFGADSEFTGRIKKRYGKDRIKTLNDILYLAKRRANSLTSSKDTRLQNGARNSYAFHFQRWHKMTADPYIPYNVCRTRRPFPADASMLILESAEEEDEYLHGERSLVIKCQVHDEANLERSTAFPRIGIVGVGFVGDAMRRSLIQKGYVQGKSLLCFDKFKDLENTVPSIDKMLHVNMLFLALPTPYNQEMDAYEKDAIMATCEELNAKRFSGTVVVKSTVEPGTCESLSEQFPHLSIVHNPEFLSARTAAHDFHHQSHIVLGKTKNCNATPYKRLVKFFDEHYPDAGISECTSTESECMKICANSFYAVKVQFFTEVYLMCEKETNGDVCYERVRDMIVKNGWVNAMHTNVPGHDGQVSYGGACFPKDTKALLGYMKKRETDCAVLEACIQEREAMRKDKVVQ